MDKQKAFVVLGGSKSHLDFVLAAKKKGFITLVFDRDKDAFCSKYADIFLNESTHDVEKIIEEIKKSQYIPCGVITYSSFTGALKACALVAKEFGLKTFSVEAVQNAKDKKRMKKLFIEQNIPTPKYATVGSASEIHLLDKFRFPVIIKPDVDSMGSEGVFLMETLKQFEEHVTSWGFEKRLIVEEYIDGKLLNASGVVNDGNVTVFCIAEKFNLGKSNSFITSGFFMEPFGRKVKNEITRIIERTVAALGVDNFLFGADIILTDTDEVFLLESGFSLDVKMDRLLKFSGLNVYDILVDVAIGAEPVGLVLDYANTYALKFLFANKNGTLEKIALDKTFTEKKGFLGVEWERNTGDFVKPPKSVSDIIGWVVTSGKDRETSLETVDNYASKISSIINSKIDEDIEV